MWISNWILVLVTFGALVAGAVLGFATCALISITDGDEVEGQ
jgi:hypothetical protein